MVNLTLDKYSIKDFRRFLNGCKTIKENPTMNIEKDKIKLVCGSERLRYYGEMKNENFTEFEVLGEIPPCPLDLKDVSQLITSKTDRLRIKNKDGNKLGFEYFENEKPVYDSELECSK